MRKHILEFIKLVISQVICGGILLATFAWLAGTSLDLSQGILQYSWIMSSVLGMIWLASLIGILGMAIVIAANLTSGYRWLRHDIQPFLVKPFSFQAGLVA